MDLVLGIAGIAIGAAGIVIGVVVARFYARREERSLARLPEQFALVALTLIPKLVDRGLIERGKESEAQAVTQEVLSSSLGMTQTEMNQSSFQAFKQADEELQSAYERLRAHIAPEERQLLAEAQDAWKTFRGKEVRFAGALHKGGSIQPLILNSTALALTRGRLADLKRTYDHRRRTTVPFEEQQPNTAGTPGT